MKKLLLVLAVIPAIAAGGMGLLSYVNRSLSLTAGKVAIEDPLKKTLEENESLSSLLLMIHSPKKGYYQQFVVDTKSHTDSEPATIVSRYHSASIGKTFCATIFGLLDKYIGRYENPNYYRWAIFEKAGKECIGQIAYFLMDDKNHFGEIEYCIASRKVIEKGGFCYERTQRDFFSMDGGYVDRLFYSILEEEYRMMK